jgi:hypothetical protein
VNLPWTTVDRQCQALHMLGVLSCEEEEVSPERRVWWYSLAETIDPQALREPSPDLFLLP